MKRFIFIMSLLLPFVMEARTLKIIKLNTESIKIGSHTCSVNSLFDDSETIYWTSDTQAMLAKYIDGNREIMNFTAASFNQKQAKSPQEYYLRTNHPSTRGGDDLSISQNKFKFPNKRIALIIGNSNYEYLSNLNNPLNDAFDISKKLKDLGFDVITLYDINYTDFEKSLKKISGAAQGYDVVLFYYSGHGIQYNGQNYLVPIDAKLDTPNDLWGCVDLEDVYAKLNKSRCETKLIFLDACRNEPKWEITGERFNEQDVSGIRVVYSTAPNAFAFDSNERNSPFAQSFLENVDIPTQNVLTTISNISASLNEITQNLGLPKQEVHDFGTSSIDFTFINADQKEDNLNIENLNISQIEELAKKGDSRAYIPAAKYYLKNAFGYQDYLLSYNYAMKAWKHQVHRNDAIIIFEALESLGFFKFSDNTNPLKEN